MSYSCNNRGDNLENNPAMKHNPEADHSSFYSQFRGKFYGILKWHQLDELWQRIKSQTNTNWYIYAVGEAVPETPVTEQQLSVFISEINTLLRKEHENDYCGIVYVDSLTEPRFVKIYDPNNLGVVCGYSNNPPLPGWTLSFEKPELLDRNTFLTQSRKRWWQRLFPAAS